MNQNPFSQRNIAIGLALFGLLTSNGERAERSQILDQQRQQAVTDELQRVATDRAIARQQSGRCVPVLDRETGKSRAILEGEVVLGSRQEPLSPGVLVCDALGGTALIGPGSVATDFAQGPIPTPAPTPTPAPVPPTQAGIK